MKAYAVKINPRDPDRKIIASAADVIRKGGLVVFPTETVYGIAANLLDTKAIGRLREIKAERQDKPFTVHISDVSMMDKMGCYATKEALSLISKFWPGPLTIVLKDDKGGTVGFRMPANKVALELIKQAGVPVVAPSANLSGNKAPTSAEAALKDLADKVDIIIDAGNTEIGIESTVVDMTVAPPKVLREGAVKKKELFEVLKI